MSHFVVMVIGENPEDQLAPYHEYECTGVDDEYVVDIDCTNEVEEWLNEVVYVGVRKDNGDLDYTSSSKWANENFEGSLRVSTRGEYIEDESLTLEEEVNDWFGYKLSEDGKWIQHTNPNAKWDWYQVGGRWTGFFKLKDPSQGEVGEPSLVALAANGLGALPESGYADQTLKGNIDLEGMMQEQRDYANKKFDHLEKAMGDTVPISWKTFREVYEKDGFEIDDIRALFRETPFMKALGVYLDEYLAMPRDERPEAIFSLWGDVYEEFHLNLPLSAARKLYVEEEAMSVIIPFAFVKDSKWVERGEMGWWACVSNEKDKNDWAREFFKMFNELPDDTLITMVDCHI